MADLTSRPVADILTAVTTKLWVGSTDGLLTLMVAFNTVDVPPACSLFLTNTLSSPLWKHYDEIDSVVFLSCVHPTRPQVFMSCCISISN